MILGDNFGGTNQLLVYAIGRRWCTWVVKAAGTEVIDTSNWHGGFWPRRISSGAHLGAGALAALLVDTSS